MGGRYQVRKFPHIRRSEARTLVKLDAVSDLCSGFRESNEERLESGR